MKQNNTISKLFLFLLISAQLTHAQRITINGAVLDSTSKPLQFATVMLLNPKDSSLVNFGRTDHKGLFELKNVATANYLFKINFNGYEPFWQAIVPDAAQVIEMGVLKMQPKSKLLDELVVKADIAPVKMIGDTIVFNAGSFKTKQNAVVEDLLKKLPGVEVDKQGNVKAQGERVTRITVDGKEFFGRDPKIATKNLPADAIDKVKVYDKRSDQADFTGIDDGQRQKNIDLTLKDDRKKGMFGNGMLGYGPDSRYQSKLNLNRFNKAKQFSVIGMGNNINEQGFSINDYLNFSGGMNRLLSGRGTSIRIETNGDDDMGAMNFGQRPNGFMRNWSGGLNFNNPVSKKTEINGSYMYTNLNHVTDRSINRDNFITNQNFTSKSNTVQENLNQNHKLNLTLDHKIDSLNSVTFKSYFSFNQLETVANGINETLSAEGLPRNKSTRQNDGDGNGVGLNSSLLFKHKFMKRGRTFSSNLDLNLNNNNAQRTLTATNDFFEEGKPSNQENIKQLNDIETLQNTVGLNSVYTEPLGKKRYLEFIHLIQRSRNETISDIFDLKEGRRDKNSLLSNAFESDYLFSRLGSNIRFNRKKFNFSTGLNFQQSTLNGESVLLTEPISRSFANVLPNMHFNYNFRTSEVLRVDYETSFQEPSINQLAPVIDNRDPLNIFRGNPNLRPEYRHRVSLGYNRFEMISFKSIFANLGLNLTQNSFTQALSFDNDLRQTIQPINLKNRLDLFAMGSYGFRIKPIKTRFEIAENINLNQGYSLVDAVENKTINQGYSTNLKANYEREKFDASIEAKIGINTAQYNQKKTLNQRFFNNNYNADFNWTVWKDMVLSSDFDYMVFKGRSDGFNQKLPLWGASISSTFLKNKRGELKFSVRDILNRNTTINRTAQFNFVQDEIVRTLGRVFQLSFTYSMRGLGAGNGVNVKVIR